MAEKETKDIVVSGGAIDKKGIESLMDNVFSVSPEYNEYMVRSLLTRSLMGGTREMKEQGQIFLPKDPLEGDTKYKNRLARSTLFNMFRKTAQFLAGLVFQSKIILPDGISEGYKEDFKDIDLKGHDLESFLKDVFEEGISNGVCHIYTCAPRKKEDMSVADAAEAGVLTRPYFRLIKAVDVIAWIVDEDSLDLLQVRIRETKKKRVGDYGWKLVHCIRVLEPGKWELWEKSGTDNVYAKAEDGTSTITDSIPIATFIPAEEWSELTGESPLQDLADLDEAHWRSNSDQNNILHVARVPLLFSKFLDLTKVNASSANMINSDNEFGDLKFVEHSGTAITAGQIDLDKLEEKMTLYGLHQILNSESGAITATEKAINTAESNSSLSSWAVDFESVMRLALDWYAEYKGEELDTDSLMVNRNFMTAALAAMDATVLMLAVEKRILSKELVFGEFVRRGMIAEDSDWVEVKAQIEDDSREAVGAMEKLLGAGFDKDGNAVEKKENNDESGATNNSDADSGDEGSATED